jgi:hypothetical protein
MGRALHCAGMARGWDGTQEQERQGHAVEFAVCDVDRLRTRHAFGSRTHPPALIRLSHSALFACLAFIKVTQASRSPSSSCLRPSSFSAFFALLTSSFTLHCYRVLPRSTAYRRRLWQARVNRVAVVRQEGLVSGLLEPLRPRSTSCDLHLHHRTRPDHRSRSQHPAHVLTASLGVLLE